MDEHALARTFEHALSTRAETLTSAVAATAAALHVHLGVGRPASALQQRLGGATALASGLLDGAFGVRLAWLPPTPCDLRCERAAPSARAACAARQERCARTLQLSGHVDAPAPLATTTGGLQITYEPSLMGGVGIALAVMLVMYMYAMELAMFNPEPP